MKQLLYAVLFLNVAFIQAQNFESVVFTNKETQETRTINVGSTVKVWFSENGKNWKAKGELITVDNENLYLTKNMVVPMASVTKLKYFDPRERWTAGFMIVMGIFFIILALLTVGLFLSGEGGIVLIMLLGLGIAIGTVGALHFGALTHKLHEPGTLWEVEIIETTELQSP